jgi:Tfp pilus assembly protein PilW
VFSRSAAAPIARGMAYARLLRRRLTRQAGFTLIELLVATATALVVFGAVLSLVVVALHQQASSSNRADTLDAAQVTVAQITKDLRQACSTASSSLAVGGGTPSAGTRLTFSVGTVAGDCASATTAVTWDCGGGSCVRTVGTAHRTYATGVTGAPVFTCQNPPGTAATCGPSTTYVLVSLVLLVPCAREGRAPTGCPATRTVQVTDGVSLRNA